MKMLLLASVATMMTALPAAAQDVDTADEDTIVVLGSGLEATPAVTAYSTVEVTRDQLLTAASGRLEDSLAMWRASSSSAGRTAAVPIPRPKA